VITVATFTKRIPRRSADAELSSNASKLGTSYSVLLSTNTFSITAPRRVHVMTSVSIDATLVTRIALRASVVSVTTGTAHTKGFCVPGSGANRQASGGVSFTTPPLAAGDWIARIEWSVSGGTASCRPASQPLYEHATVSVDEVL
jgi:hypothetical protein